MATVRIEDRNSLLQGLLSPNSTNPSVLLPKEERNKDTRRSQGVRTRFRGSASVAIEDESTAPRWRFARRLLDMFGMESPAEGKKVLFFVLQAFLNNSFFVIGRNVGTVLFLKNGFGAEYLPAGMLASGILTVISGQVISCLSGKTCPAKVYQAMLLLSAVVLGSLYASTLAISQGYLESWFQLEGSIVAAISASLYSLIFLMEDILTNFTAMQNATVAQASFSVTKAKKLFGLVQLGNSIAAMSIGVCIGSIAELLGPPQLVGLQVILLLFNLLPNRHIMNVYVDQTGKDGKRKRRQAEIGDDDDSQHWWKNVLVLAMGFWSFTVIFAKTMFEYEYNILVIRTMSAAGMVRLTGYLYAGAGLASSVLNVVGTTWCFESMGVKGAILATPGSLLTASVAILCSPSVMTTFAGRLVDLSLRWSINNSVKSVLWIAVPQATAMRAKPWVEGTTKKLGTSFNALVISLILGAVGGMDSPNSITALSLCALVVTGLMFVICFRVYSYYLDSMWRRIKRRELRLAEVPFTNRNDSRNAGSPWNPSVPKPLLHRILHGGTAEQLYLLREIGANLGDEDWGTFFSHFNELPTAVQVKAIELGRVQPDRVPDEFLVSLISERGTKAAVVTVALLAIGERGLYDAVELIQYHFGNQSPAVRAAASAAILIMGWGVGMGAISSAALLVLENMLGFRLAVGGLKPRNSLNTTVTPMVQFYSGGTPEELTGRTDELQQKWEAAIASGDTKGAIALAIELTYAKAAMVGPRPAPSPLPAPPVHETRLTTTEIPRRASDFECHFLSPPNRQRSCSESSYTGAKPVVFSEFTEMATAIDVLKQLPDPRELLPVDQFMLLLRHQSHKVRIAALTLVLESDTQLPTFRDEVFAIVRCLCSPDTYGPAESALSRLGNVRAAKEEALAQLRQGVEAVRNFRQNHLESMQKDSPEESSAVAVSSMTSSTIVSRKSIPTVRVINLLKYLQRQTYIYPESSLIEEQADSTICDDLLGLSPLLPDADAQQQLLGTIIDLKAQGFSMTRELAEARTREVARQIYRGFAVQQWVRQLNAHNMPAKAAASRVYNALISQVGGADGAGVSTAAVEASSEETRHIILGIANKYIDEHIYLQKLHLLQLAALAASGKSQKSTRVLAAWRVLRSQDTNSQAAVLEVLESMLSPSVKSRVLPVFEESSLEKKLSAGAACGCEELRPVIAAYSESRQPPPWLQAWFSQHGDRLGDELGLICYVLAGIAGAGENYVPPSDALLPKLVLLSNARLFADLLAIHVAEIAASAATRTIRKGVQLCQSGETYVVVSGAFVSRPSGRSYHRGSVIQELHFLNKELTVRKVVCTSPNGAKVLVLSEQPIFEMMYRLPPKFALSILKALIRVLPAPTQTGGSRTYRASSTGTEGQMVTTMTGEDEEAVAEEDNKGHPQLKHTESTSDLTMLASAQVNEDDSLAMPKGIEEGEEDDTEGAEDSKSVGNEEGFIPDMNQGSKTRGRQATFSLLEKLVLLQGVKMFRYVTLEYLPSIAACCTPVFYAAKKEVFVEGEPTNATLYIVAEGMVGIYHAAPVVGTVTSKSGRNLEDTRQLERRLLQGDSMGNTSLLSDLQWQYSATAIEDTWLLCISRNDLTDLLRGRRELASDVIRGLYKTFQRRMQQVANSDMGTRSWLFSADYSRQSDSLDSPMAEPSRSPFTEPLSPLTLPTSLASGEVKV
eukprot:TRINITY_DN43238_c0_g1_i1.p1 TRINITY_DN43238_c0_g1~~TRINITY_DN43238_c0_g1_i1.p1  ORF type:complete len:1725 (-),score=333.40 TRINITY_DN43238_c0_g1_i1:113-5209(-)